MRSSASAGSLAAAVLPPGAVVALGGATLAPPHAATSAAMAIRAPVRKRRTVGRMTRCICFLRLLSVMPAHACRRGGRRPRCGLAAYGQTQVRALRSMGAFGVARADATRTGAGAKDGQAAQRNS